MEIYENEDDSSAHVTRQSKSKRLCNVERSEAHLNESGRTVFLGDVAGREDDSVAVGPRVR